MPERKINLEELYYKHKGCNINISKIQFKNAVKEVCKQVLELAAENAEGDIVDDTNYSNGRVVIDKQSILNTINQIE